MSRTEQIIQTDRVAVIVVNFNAGSYLNRCLLSLQLQSYSNLTTIVVDNGSTDGSLDAARQLFPEISFIQANKNLGFAAGNNAGLTAAKDCQWIALLNPDAFAAPDWLEKLMVAAKTSPDFAFFGCRMRLADSPQLLDGTGDVYHVSGMAWRRDYRKSLQTGVVISGEIFGPCAAAALYRKSVLNEAGGFDESYFCYHEDIDLAFRLRLLGYRCLYIPEAVVDHVSSGITGIRSNFSTYYGHRNLVWTYVKDMPGWAFWVYLPLHILQNIVGILVCVARGQGLVVLRAKRDAILGLSQALKKRREIQSRRRATTQQVLSQMAKGMSFFWRK